MNDLTAVTFTSPRRPIGRGEPLYPTEPRKIGDLFYAARQNFPNIDLLNRKQDGEWQRLSAAEVVTRCERVAFGLYSLGLRKGDRVAILAPNSPEWTITDAGCQMAGIIDVPIYTTLAATSVEFVLKDSGARVLFLEDRASYESLLGSIWKDTAIESVVLFRGEPGDEGTIGFDFFLERGDELHDSDAALIDRLREAVAPEDVATLIYTSGTTGEPKGVMLTHHNIISNVIDVGEKYDFSARDVPLSVLPLSHIFERSAMYLYIYHGMSVHYAESIDKVPENLSEVRPTIFIGVPRIFEKVYEKAKLRSAHAGGIKERLFDWAIEVAKQYAMKLENDEAVPFVLAFKHRISDRLVFSKFRAFFGGRMRACITGGAALPDDIYLIYKGAGVSIMQGYGLTETSPVITSNNPEYQRLGSVGKPIRNVEIRIADDGEIEATGPGVMLGYYKKPDATRGVFTSDGWFGTGDIGRIDEDGFLFVTDRKKELFKTSGGKYVAPSPIEQMIRSSRFVNQVVLVGNGRKFAAALIVPNFAMLESYAKHKGLDLKTPDEFCSSPKIVDLIERQVAKLTEGLSRFETVKRIALLKMEFSVEGGELTPTLKIKRRVIDTKYKDVIDRLYAEN